MLRRFFPAKTGYLHAAAVNIDHTEVIRCVIIKNMPYASIDSGSRRIHRSASGAIEEMDYLVFPLGRWDDLRVGRNAAVDSLPGIKMVMAAKKDAKTIIIQDSPQFRIGSVLVRL